MKRIKLIKRSFQFMALFALIGLSVYMQIPADQAPISPLSEDIVPTNVETTEDPESANYGEHRTYMPYGVYIDGPSYFERYVGQTDMHIIDFRLVDTIRNDGPSHFERYKIFIDGTQVEDEETFGLTEFNYNISDYLSEVGEYDIQITALHTDLEEWISIDAVLNVTVATGVVLDTYYDDFYLNRYTQGSESKLSWIVGFDHGGTYSYTISVNDIVRVSQNDITDMNIEGNYDTLSFTFNLGVFEINLTVIDQYGWKTANVFNITVAGQQRPSIQQLELNTNDREFVLWETTNAKIKVTAMDPDGDLDKIIIFLVQWDEEGNSDHVFPFVTISDAQNFEDYEVLITSAMLIPYMNEGQDGNYFNFRAIAVDKSGKETDNNVQEVSFGMRDPTFRDGKIVDHIVRSDILATKGRNVQVLTVSEEQTDADWSFGVAVILDATGDTKVTVLAATATVWQRNMGNEHCRSEYNDNYDNNNNNGDPCDVFAGDNQNHDWYFAGVVFWLSFEDPDLIVFPITVEIQYPDWMKPDEIIEEPPLKMLSWIDDWSDTSRMMGYWDRMDSENIEAIETNKVSVNIYSDGLYGYGMDSMDYNQNDGGDGIPGFPLEIMIGFIAVGIIASMKKINKKRD